MSEKKKQAKDQEETKVEETAAQAEVEESAKEEAPDPVKDLENQLADLNDKYLRLAAEYDNFRKRTIKEKEALYNDGKMDTVAKILEVYDNLERGINQCEEGSPYRQGLEMILKQFVDTLSKIGVSKMEAVGQPFNPERHNAVMHIEDESYEENTVVEVFQQGFLLGERVLRVAMVKVAN